MAEFISYKGFHWEYESYGSGPEIMLAFHGFGNVCSDFKVLEPSLGGKYKIISFNLPFHGNSTIDPSVAEKTISKRHLKEFIEKVLNLQGAKKFSLMGYSLGGKIVLQLIELFPGRINTAFLIAPDGLRPIVSNAFVTRSALGKILYQRIINDPSGFFRLVDFLHRIKLVNRKMRDFIRESLSTRKKREMVWDVWMCFRELHPSVKKVQRIVNENGIRLHLFFGLYDRIIPPSIGQKFVKGISDRHSLHIVEAGHNLVKEKLNKSLEEVTG